VSVINERLDVELVHIGGKTARGSYDREGQLKALHRVSTWNSEHGLVLEQQKSNEIMAVPPLLKLLNLKGTIVTLDAMGTQTTMPLRLNRPRETMYSPSKGIRASSIRR